MPQYGGNGEQSHGFGPEVVGGKIMDPGIDQKNMWSVAGHLEIVVRVD